MILFEDNHLILAVKPPGVLSQADGSASPDMLTLLKQDIKTRYQKPGEVFLGLVHRLDQPVGGIMVFARTSKAASRLSAQIREHQLAKYYLAVVHGCPSVRQGQLRDQLLQDPVTRQVRVLPDGQPGGQAAWLDYLVLENRPDLDRSLLAIRLGSGRGHQIRVQLASRQCPIVGDRRYGRMPNGILPMDIALFACLLGFFHPTTREWLEFGALPANQPPWSDFSQPDVRSLPGLFDQK